MKIEKDYFTSKFTAGGGIVKNKYFGINFIDIYY